MSKTAHDIAEMVKDWAIEEGILSRKIPVKEELEFGFELKLPPNVPFQKVIALLCLKDKDFLLFQLGTQMSPEHAQIMKQTSPEKQAKFFSKMQKFLYEQSLLFNLDPSNLRWMIMDQLYFDGITKNAFFTMIRRLFSASRYIDHILGEIVLGGKPGPINPTNTGSGSSLYM